MSSTITRSGRAFAATVLAVAVIGAGTTSANAKGREVRSSGSCSGTSVWKLKAKTDNRKIQVEAEVDTTKVGTTWSVKLADNGTRFASVTRTTLAPSGSFTVSRLITNQTGSDRITLVATNAATGERCSGTVVF
jgi:hypothetical protein